MEDEGEEEVQGEEEVDGEDRLVTTGTALGEENRGIYSRLVPLLLSFVLGGIKELAGAWHMGVEECTVEAEAKGKTGFQLDLVNSH